MNYITAEQFREQPEEVQKVFFDWWKPQLGDLNYSEKYGIKAITSDFEHLTEYLISTDQIRFRKYNTPLLTLQQLWGFIEDSGYQVGTSNFIEKDVYVVKLFNHMMKFEPDVECADKDKLQAFWKCACEVAKVIK